MSEAREPKSVSSLADEPWDNSPAASPDVGAPASAVSENAPANAGPDPAVDAVADKVGGVGIQGDSGAAAGADAAMAAAIAAEIDPLLRGDEKDDLVVQQADPTSVLYSLHSFEDLGHLEGTLPIPETVLKGIRDNGFKQPSKIQEKALPILLRSNKKTDKNPTGRPENMIFQSQAGTGKTGAFGITMLSKIDPAAKYPQGIVVAPTFSLVVQIYEQFTAWSKYMEGVTIGLCYGLGDKKAGIDIRDVPPPVRARGNLTEQILVCTTGKIRNLVETQQRRQFDPSKVMMFVSDEADAVFLDEKFKQDMRIIMGKLTSPMLQTVMLSATFDEDVLKLITPNMKEPLTTISLPLQQCTMDNVRQLAYVCSVEGEDKMMALEVIYKTVKVGQTIIFVNEVQTADNVSRVMTGNGFSVAVLHGRLTKGEQHRTLTRFRAGTDKVLVSTNALARGVDVKAVTMVVNFDIPSKKVFTGRGRNDYQVAPDFETYLHRIGRTGRFGRKGAAINLIGTQKDADMVQEIAQYWQTDIKQIDIHDEKAMKKNVKK